METVIAKSKKSLMAGYIVIIVLGAIFIGAGAAILSLYDELIGGVVLGCGVLFLIVGIVWTVIIAKLPKNYVTFKDGKLHFSNGVECSPSELDYCDSRAWSMDSLIFGYGTLIVSVKRQVYKFRFAANVTNVINQLNQLKKEYILVESVQKQIAEKNAAKQAEAAEQEKTETVENTQTEATQQ